MNTDQTRIALRVDGQLVQANAGDTLFEAARKAGVEVPTLCHHDDLPPDGSCRLCSVEVAGEPRPAAACMLYVREGMEVRTETPALIELRRQILRMLLGRYHDSACDAETRPPSAFMRWVDHYEAGPRAGLAGAPVHAATRDPNPFIEVDLDKCILCTRCVRACADVQGRFVWGIGARGPHAEIVAGLGGAMLEADCESCGACVAYCPTGALADKPSLGAGRPDRLVRTTCPYCGVGCSFDLAVKNDRIVKVETTSSAPVNGLHTCVKGRYGYEFVHHEERLTRPRVRQYLLQGDGTRPLSGRGDWVDTDWPTALGIVAKRLVRIRKQSGPDAVGLLASAKCTNEENYLMQKLARQVVGTHNVDHCARLCHSSTVAGLAACFGSGAMSNTMADIAQAAKAILVIGSNTTEQHPVFGAMLRQAVLQRDVPMVVADPRAVEIAEFAALHVRHRPGTDVALINGLMHIVLRERWQDETFIAERTENFEAVEAVASRYPPERVARITGVPVHELATAAELLACNKPMAVIWAMGITQHTTGVSNVLSLGNLQMLLGNMGVAGGGVNPLRGQNNVQGACDMGALPNVFPGYQSVNDSLVTEKFAAAWSLQGPDAAKSERFSDRTGLTVTEMVRAAGEGELRALLIMGENPAATDPNLNHARACLERAEFTVLSEIFPSQSAVFADVLLPAASWAEKEGAFTNTERRVQLIREAVPAPGEALPDWQMLSALAKEMLSLEHRVPIGAHAGWQYDSAAEIQAEISALTPSYMGVSHARLEQGDALHWPVSDTAHGGTPILHVGRFTRGLGRFHACEHLDADELPDNDYPLLLTTGRVLYHWHAGEMTHRVDGLEAVCPASYVEINPADAAAFSIEHGEFINLVSRRGRMRGTAYVTERVGAGLVFGNFHFAGEANVNNVTADALDPVAKIPEYKVCAVRIER